MEQIFFDLVWAEMEKQKGPFSPRQRNIAQKAAWRIINGRMDRVIRNLQGSSPEKRDELLKNEAQKTAKMAIEAYDLFRFLAG